MEEKQIISSSNDKKMVLIFRIVLIVLACLSVVSFIMYFYGENYKHEASQYYDSKSTHSYIDKNNKMVTVRSSVSSKDIKELADSNYPLWGFWSDMTIVCFVLMIVLPVLTIALGVFYFAIRKMRIVITDKRIYGNTTFAKSVELPIESISACGLCALNGVYIDTSSRKIVFLLMKNKSELQSIISNLIIDNNSPKTNDNMNNTQNSEADEIKKYKELLDSGVITQEEFYAKKKQLLDL